MNSQLRQDIVSGDWIVIASARAKRPEQFLKKEKRAVSPIKNCPFEDLQKSGHGEPILIYLKKKNWQVQVVENKYPAFFHRKICAEAFKNGPYSVVEGIGRHELIITREHLKNFPHLNKVGANLVFKSFQERYQEIAKDKCLSYISIFHNWGEKAGASIYHPHYQVIATPVIPPEISYSLKGSLDFSKKIKKCVHCETIKWEKKIGRRIVYENRGAIVLSPFAPRSPYELRVFPKKHLSYFENTDKKDLEFVVDALQKSLAKIEKKLKDPDYNFFIHTSPIKNKKNYKYYHWHIEILPRIEIPGAFEYSTGMTIVGVDPDEAAKILR